jgi:hypothetical protein
LIIQAKRVENFVALAKAATSWHDGESAAGQNGACWSAMEHGVVYWTTTDYLRASICHQSRSGTFLQKVIFPKCPEFIISVSLAGLYTMSRTAQCPHPSFHFQPVIPATDFKIAIL